MNRYLSFIASSILFTAAFTLGFLEIRTIVTTLAINIFFRKSFRVINGLQLLVLMSMWISTEIFLILTLLLFGSSKLQREIHIGIHNWDSQDCFNMVCTSGFLSYSQIVVPNSLATWITIPFLSFFQILRNPRILKVMLRPVRVGLGPACILNALMTGWFVISDPQSPIFDFIISFFCMISAFVAGILLRPDNTEIIQYFRTEKLSVSTITEAHACLNISAVFFSCIMCFTKLV